MFLNNIQVNELKSEQNTKYTIFTIPMCYDEINEVKFNLIDSN